MTLVVTTDRDYSGALRRREHARRGLDHFETNMHQYFFSVGK